MLIEISYIFGVEIILFHSIFRTSLKILTQNKPMSLNWIRVSRAWTQLTTKLDIDWRGPVNIVRFAPNAGKHHVLAVGAKDVHVIHITQTLDKNKFKFEPQKMISDQLNKINLEKCWVSVNVTFL